MKIVNKVALGSMGVVLITNPLTGQYILTGLEKAFTLIFVYGSPINLIASVIVCMWLIKQLWDTRDKPTVKQSKARAVKVSDYIKT